MRATLASGPDAPISVLGLSVRAYNAAYRNGIRTIGQLAAVPDDALLAHRQIGEKTRRELRDRLAQYVALNPDALTIPAAVAESVVVDRVAWPDARQLRWQALADDKTPIVALDLSRRAFQSLFRAGIHTVAALSALSQDDLAGVRGIGPTSVAEIEAKLAAYAGKPIRGAVAAGPPAHVPTAVESMPQQKIRVEEIDRWLDHVDSQFDAVANGSERRPSTLAAECHAWLNGLDERARQIVRLGYGFDGPALTLKEVAQRLGTPRERVRQIERKALKGLRVRYSVGAFPSLSALAALLRHELIVREEGWSLEECVEWLRLRDEFRLGAIEPVALLSLLCAMDEQFVLWPRHNVIALVGMLPGTSRRRSQLAELKPVPSSVSPHDDSPSNRTAYEATPSTHKGYEVLRPANREPASDPRRLAVWPNLWPDKWRDHDSFMGFLTYANGLLGRLPTVAAWSDDLLRWAHRSPNRSVEYRQRLLDCAYIVGLIDRLHYVKDSKQRLSPALAAPVAASKLRDHSIRSALARLEHAPWLLEQVAGRSVFGLEDVQQKLGLDDATAAGHLRLFHLLGLVYGGPTCMPTPLGASFLNRATAGQTRPATPRLQSPTCTPRAKETQSQLLLRALGAIGRPAHVSEILPRAAELTRGTTVPKPSVALLLLLQSNERAAISLGEGVFSLTEWEAARARETHPMLPICPRPWVDVRTFHERLLESVFAAARQLRDEPTAAEFQARMLAWWGVDTGARLWVRQSMLSAYYLLGVVPFAFAGDSQRPLRAELPPLGVAETRDHCRRALDERLAAMPAWLDTLRRLGPARPKELAAAFAPLHPYGLNDVEARLHLLAGLGVAERLSDGTYRLIGTAGAAARDEVAADGAGDAPSGRLRACPALLPDRPGEGHTFLESVVQAGKVLERAPTVDRFLREMIAWAGSDYPKSRSYYQNILDAYYVVGLIDRTSYARQRRAILRSTLPPVEDTAALRDHCIRAALDRLDHGRRLLEAAAQLQPFTRRQMAEALGMTDHDGSYHIRLFVSLGVLTQEGTILNLSPLGTAYCNDKAASYAARTSSHTVRETKPVWFSEDGLEALAYLIDD